MRYGSVPGIDKKVSRLGQGIGAAVRKEDPAEGFELLDGFFEKGVTVFDTARVYGKTDRFLGDWMRERGNRAQVVVLGKGAHHGEGRQRVTPEDIEADLLRSLEDLQTEYIDLYILHRDDPSLPVGPIVEALNEHHRAGRIHAFGGSNWTHTRLEEANAYAAAHGLVPFAVSNPQFSLAEQIKEPWENCISISGPKAEEARAWYAAHKMPLFTWSSLAGGFFAGTEYTRENAAELLEQGGRHKMAVGSYGSDENYERLARARQLAAQKGVSVAQVALAWVMSQPLEIFALVGSATPAELEDNIDALGLTLSPEELAWLDMKA
jgi:aryl-alcohol dehydrogenase-like predicted oxidoreductase